MGSMQDRPVEGFAIRSDNAMFGVDYPHPETIFPSAIDQARALAANAHVTEDADLQAAAQWQAFTAGWRAGADDAALTGART